ncbi:MAG TPA: serine/threonine-protein kinase [Gemmatimonadales bacterium]|nr:serine/threonine-protein kinase [Gemmatimonadales bacterium]
MRTAPPVDPLFLAFQSALAGRYSIDRELGRGGMGVVYLAREVHLDRLVAIKLLPPERAAVPALRARFLREARLAAKLSHPNITPIHAVAETEGFVFFVMAYIDGQTLTERVLERGPLPIADGTRMLREAAWALAHAHGQGLVHRDVKPDNILLEAATGRALVVDFGIAAAAGDAVEAGISGTPDFMSPEQALAGTIDARSDLYGLGATAFFAFAGRPPFEGASATEVLAKQVTEPAPSLLSLGLTVPRKVAQLIERCLEKDPADRPASAEAVAEQLSAALEQRRELPVALRVFAKRSGRIDGGGTILSFVALYAAIGAASIFLGPGWALATFLAGATVPPLLYLVNAARKLRMQGYSHADVIPAFKREIETGREERGGRGAVPGRAERVLGPIAKWSWISVGLSFGSLMALGGLGVTSDAVISWIVRALSVSGMVAGPAALGVLALRQRRTDIDAELWAKVWAGRIGRLAFSLARPLVGKRAIGPAMTHRATELSLGMAAEQLYEALPKATRDALGELPDVLERLQRDAQALRGKLEGLQDALTDAGGRAVTEGYADVRAARDAVQQRLADAVGALETIRLNLLRLHAGALTVEGLTTHLNVAAEVSDVVERLVAAQDEIESDLRLPRARTPTPA